MKILNKEGRRESFMSQAPSNKKEEKWEMNN
jgi:hypothetical protein